MEPPATDRTKRQKSHEFYKKLIKLTVAGGLAFWVVDLAMSLSPISAEYMAAFSISSLPLALVTAFIGGLVIAFYVSFFLLRFFNKIPTKNPILKALILSFAAIIIIEVLSTFSNPNNAYVYLLVDTVMNIPRILALGIVVGYLYKKLYGSFGINNLKHHPS
jgi:hypothetical protein